MAEPIEQRDVGSRNDGKLFAGVRFVLAGFDEASELEFQTELERNGGQDMGRYCASCTHVIVCELTLDDPICLAAQKDGKELVTDQWVADCLQMGTLMGTKTVLYRPLKDLNGIPGSENLVLCLTGYEHQRRCDIMRMVDMMGAKFTKPLIATRVTHLICYKFEGEKYEHARHLNIKLVNHRWVQDSLLAWRLLPEADYSQSGFELEFGDIVAKDSEDDGTPESSLRQNRCLTPKIVAPSKDSKTPQTSAKQGSKARTPRSCPSTKSKGVISPGSRIQMLQSNKKGKKLNFHALLASVEGCSNSLLEGSCNQFGAGKELPVVCHPKFNKEETHTTGSTDSPNTKTKACSFSGKVHESITAHEKVEDEKLKAEDSRFSVLGVAATKAVEGQHLREQNIRMVPEEVVLASISTSPGGSRKENNVSPIVTENKQQLAYDQDSPQETRERKCAIRLEDSDALRMLPLVRNDAGTKNGQFEDNVRAANSHQDGLDVEDRLRMVTRLQEPCEDLLNNARTGNEIAPPDGRKTISSDITTGSGMEVHGRHAEVAQPVLEDGKSGNLASETNTQVIEETALSVLKSFGKPTLPIANDSQAELEILQESRQLNQVIESASILCSGKRKSIDAQIQVSRNGGVQLIQAPVQEQRYDDQNLKVGLEVDALSAQDTTWKLKRLKQGSLPASPAGNVVGECLQGNSALGMVSTTKNPGRTSYIGLLRSNLGSENLKPEADAYNLDNEFCVSPEKAQAATVSRKPQFISSKGVQRGATKNVEAVQPEGAKIQGIGKKSSSQRCQLPSANKKQRTDQKLPLAAPLKAPCNFVAEIETLRASSPRRIRQAPEMVALETVKKSVIDTNAECSDEVKAERLNLRIFPQLLYDAEVAGQGKSSGAVDQTALCNRSRVASLVADESQQHGSDRSSNTAEWIKLFSGTQRHVPPNASLEKRKVNAIVDDQGKHKAEEDIAGKVGLNGADECELRPSVDEEVHGHDVDEVDFNVDVPPVQLEQPVTQKVVTKRRSRFEVKQKMSAAVTATHCKVAKNSKENHVSQEKTGDVPEPAIQVDETEMMKLNTPVKGEPQYSVPGQTHVQRWFALSGRSKEKQKFKSIIQKLGGNISTEGPKWKDEVTHVILPAPLRRTEKFFAGAARGRWLLKPEYLEASLKENRFVEELEYEWHGDGHNGDERIELDAPRKWRKLREETGCGAFYKLRVAIHGGCTAPTLDTLTRAIKAGGGKVVATAPPYTQYLSAVDFALINRDISPKDKWVKKFINHGIACVTVDYLVDYVCKPSCDLEQHILYGTNKAVELARGQLDSCIAAAAKIYEGVEAMEEKLQIKDTALETYQGEDEVDSIVCSICSRGDREEVLMLCGDEKGNGCGMAVHIDCCIPPLKKLPVKDWFCKRCAKRPRKCSRAKKS